MAYIVMRPGKSDVIVETLGAACEALAVEISVGNQPSIYKWINEEAFVITDQEEVNKFMSILDTALGRGKDV